MRHLASTNKHYDSDAARRGNRMTAKKLNDREKKKIIKCSEKRFRKSSQIAIPEKNISTAKQIKISNKKCNFFR